MITHNYRKTFSVLKLFEKFIRDMRKGKRLQPDGRRISPKTIENYTYTLLVLKKFCINRGFYLRLLAVSKMNVVELIKERNYWRGFYKKFADYMYNDCNYFDNYVGGTIRKVRAFFNYLNKELVLGIGEFHKSFYTREEEIPVITLQPDQLQFLISNTDFENSLPGRLKKCKNTFVFGCTVGLRFCDLMDIRLKDLEYANGNCYLSARSKKTDTPTKVKLPSYAVNIITATSRFRKPFERIFTLISLNQFNRNLRALAEKAGWTQEIGKQRSKEGKNIEITMCRSNKSYRFCDLLSSHVMRRTAITTMLMLGMKEDIVRKISGHAANSKSFFRYVNYAQPSLDDEIDKFHNRFEEGVQRNSSECGG